jgi:hypothetical protein
MKGTTMNKDEAKQHMQEIEKAKWQEFCLKFPSLAGGSFWAKLAMILWKHRNEDLVKIIWTNGFYLGWNQGIDIDTRAARASKEDAIEEQESEQTVKECYAAADRMDWDWFKVRFGPTTFTPPPGSVHPEPKSGQPESPGHTASSHNPTDGSPDANPSK